MELGGCVDWQINMLLNDLCIKFKLMESCRKSPFKYYFSSNNPFPVIIAEYSMWYACVDCTVGLYCMFACVPSFQYCRDRRHGYPVARRKVVAYVTQTNSLLWWFLHLDLGSGKYSTTTSCGFSCTVHLLSLQNVYGIGKWDVWVAGIFVLETGHGSFWYIFLLTLTLPTLIRNIYLIWSAH